MCVTEQKPITVITVGLQSYFTLISNTSLTYCSFKLFKHFRKGSGRTAIVVEN